MMKQTLIVAGLIVADAMAMLAFAMMNAGAGDV